VVDVEGSGYCGKVEDLARTVGRSMFFMGTYPEADEKGRLILPAKFRDRLSEGSW
jgi:hypothetical protein